MALSDNLKKARLRANLSQAELAKKLDLNVRTYGSYERGERDVSTSLLRKICQELCISSDELLENSFATNDTNVRKPASDDSIFDRFDNVKPIKLKRFPMLGEIACGEPIWAEEDRESYVMADMDIGADFCLTAKGDSMINARINDGDIVFIKEMPIVENGEIAAVIIDNEATLKRFYYDRESNFLQLVAENPKYSPLVYRDEQLDTIRVLGKAVYFMSAVE